MTPDFDLIVIPGGFAPDFIPSMFRGENRVFTRAEDMEHLLEGLRLAAGEAT